MRLSREPISNGKIARVEDRGDFYEVFDGKGKLMSVRKDVDVFEMLADLGFDAVICDREGEVETVKSLIAKAKSSKGVEKCGAIAIFVGFVRGISDGKKVVRLEYERFDELYQIKLKEIIERIKGQEGVVDARIYHKVGSLKPGEDILYVVVMGKDRKAVFDPLRECVELIKRELPIWKKEVYEDGEIWVHDKMLRDSSRF